MEKKSQFPVRDAMVTNVITLSSDKSIVNAAKLMQEKNIGGLVVVDNNKPLGMITERDLLSVISKDLQPNTVKVKDIMSSPIISISPDTSIIEAAKLMSENKIRKLPVKEEGKLIGIITAEDIVKIAPKEIELLLELTKIKNADMAANITNISPSKSNEGECEVCNNYSDYLYNVDDTYMCSECKQITEGEE